MKDKPAPEAKASKGTQRRAVGSLPEPAIRRQLLSDAVQHPATLLPLAVAIMSVIYLLVLSPVFGGKPWAAALLAASGIVATASFVWRYVFRHAEEYAERARELMDTLERERVGLEQAEVRQLREALDDGFSRVGSAEGPKALSGLVGEYEHLQPALRR